LQISSKSISFRFSGEDCEHDRLRHRLHRDVSLRPFRNKLSGPRIDIPASRRGIIFSGAGVYDSFTQRRQILAGPRIYSAAAFRRRWRKRALRRNEHFRLRPVPFCFLLPAIYLLLRARPHRITCTIDTSVVRHNTGVPFPDISLVGASGQGAGQYDSKGEKATPWQETSPSCHILSFGGSE
jgi:hypothetical protein